jgi:hypothetical protein
MAVAIANCLTERNDMVAEVSVEYVEEQIEDLTAEMKSGVLSQVISNRMRYFANRTSRDPATIAGEAIAKLDAEWATLETRLTVVPGKQLLAALNGRLQQDLGISIAAPQIIRNIAPDVTSSELRLVLFDLNQFAAS